MARKPNHKLFTVSVFIILYSLHLFYTDCVVPYCPISVFVLQCSYLQTAHCRHDDEPRAWRRPAPRPRPAAARTPGSRARAAADEAAAAAA